MRIYHGKIISLDKNNTIYNYLVEEKGRIIYLGNTISAEFENLNETVELGSRVLIPSFGDGHLHFSSWALIAAAFFDVRDAKNIGDIQVIIKKFISENKKLKIIVSFGISKHSLSEKRLINRKELDEACSEIPMLIVCYDGHSAVFNTKMLKKFPDKVKNLNGFNGEKGHLFNEAYFEGLDYASGMIPPLTLVKSINSAYDLLAEKGIGMIHSTEGIGFPLDLDVGIVSLIARARARNNNFQTRLFFQTMNVDKVFKRKLPRIGGCFATALDGCFGAVDAALHEPYSNDPDNKGILFHEEEQVIDFAKKSNRAGLQIEMHAIGDAAVSRAVKAIETALKDYPREDHRHTIIHACIIPPEDLKKIAELQIGITLQPGFLISPLEPVEYLNEILGPRLKISSPLKSILDAGIHLSGGSDAPVTWPDPLEGIYGACNHPYDPKQSVSIVDALKMYTYEIARTSFDENERGSLEEGKIADMLILNRDPMEMKPEDLRSLKVEKLFLKGKLYRKGLTIPGMLWKGLFARKQKI
jgi:predicted amidohydrolase YtcJ